MLDELAREKFALPTSVAPAIEGRIAPSTQPDVFVPQWPLGSDVVLLPLDFVVRSDIIQE